jgi:hypothetical protein
VTWDSVFRFTPDLKIENVSIIYSFLYTTHKHKKGQKHNNAHLVIFFTAFIFALGMVLAEILKRSQQKINLWKWIKPMQTSTILNEQAVCYLMGSPKDCLFSRLWFTQKRKDLHNSMKTNYVNFLLPMSVSLYCMLTSIVRLFQYNKRYQRYHVCYTLHSSLYDDVDEDCTTVAVARVGNITE